MDPSLSSKENRGREIPAKNKPCPEFKKGESGPHEPSLREGKTKPPHHFTENSLLGAMEAAGKWVDDDALREALKERGIGTPATRAAIIETLLKRNYIRQQQKATAHHRHGTMPDRADSRPAAEIAGAYRRMGGKA